MLPVKLQPQPPNFEVRVGKPGRDFIAATPAPTARQWANHDYWTRTLPELHALYGEICAYSCHWIPAVGGRSVEHFKPKDKHPADAYDWANYRLVFQLLNGCKGTSEDVVDPFDVQPGWFVIKFPSLLVALGDGLDEPLSVLLQTTIVKLRLNDNDKCLKDRQSWLKEYCLGRASLEGLEGKAPFLASEIRRQGLSEAIKTMMRF